MLDSLFPYLEGQIRWYFDDDNSPVFMSKTAYQCRSKEKVLKDCFSLTEQYSFICS